ncbi:DUF1810 domain-containing protein [Endozoicomonas atrinae]|uniref:DUF1810 domain-containing protein n=1 Tax=Endozoicomonas atrinae TaxID=1333660 RepID=UPI003AFF867C
MTINTLSQSCGSNNISNMHDVTEFESSSDKAWWKSRFVKVVAVGVGVLTTGALLISACYLAATIVGALTTIAAVGFTAKYLHDRYIVPTTPHTGAVKKGEEIGITNVPASAPVRMSSHNSYDPFKLQRFVDAQNNGYMGNATHTTALKEMQRGKKVTHWSWYELPIIEGFGSSDTAKYFSIKSLEEARAYYAHETLKTNLISIFQSINSHTNKSIKEIMGGDIDTAKLRSCATIFYLITKDQTFLTTLNQFFSGYYCHAANQKFSEWQQTSLKS